jgi:hypothetical protein
MIEAVTYEKMYVEWDGSFCITTAPPELLLGTTAYTWTIVSPKCALAWNTQSDAPHNVYWNEVRPATTKRERVRGGIVLFRHWAPFSWTELQNCLRLSKRRFFLLGRQFQIER